MRTWCRLWRETRGTEYQLTPIDHRFLRLGLKLAGSFDAWAERARILLVSPPSAWHAQNASPQLLYSRWNNLVTTVRAMTRDERNLASLQVAMESL